MGWVEIYNSVVVVWRNNGFNAMVRPSAEESTGSAFISPIDENFLFISVVSCDLFLFWIRVQMALLFKDL